MKTKLLAPAGTVTQGFTAVKYGADAVYAGVPGFNARRMLSAPDSIHSLEVLVGMIGRMHEMGAEVHCALNILIKDDELTKAMRAVSVLYENGADVIIMQDMGLIDLALKEFPGIVIHASTQSAVTGMSGTGHMFKKGVAGVIFPRETSFEEIKKIREEYPDSHLEMFVHGALCFSRSGQCYFSALIGGRSGNRGLCGQPCRLKYHLEGGGQGHLFSCRDLNLSAHINEILSAGIDYLKLEGRAKSPEYTAAVTAHYRELIDHGSSSLDDKIPFTFNRGFTGGLIFDDGMVINDSFIGHRGIKAGKISESPKGELFLKVGIPVGRDDGMSIPAAGAGFTAEKSAAPGERLAVPPLHGVRRDMDVFKNSDSALKRRFVPSDEKIAPAEIKYAGISVKYPVRRKTAETRLYACVAGDAQREAAVNAGAVIIEPPGIYEGEGIFRFPYGAEPEAPFNGTHYLVSDLDQAAAVSDAGKTAIPWVTMNIFNTPSSLDFERYFFSMEMSLDQILKAGTRDRGILYLDGPLPLMHTFYPMETGKYRDERGNLFSAAGEGKARILYNGRRLLAVDLVYRVFGRVCGICYDGTGDGDAEFIKRVNLYSELLSGLKKGKNTEAVKEELKAMAPYTKGLYGEGVM